MSTNRYYKVIFCLIGAVIMTAPLGSASAKQKVLGKTHTFSAETISRLRSENLKPEAARPVMYGRMIVLASSRKKIVTFDASGKKLDQVSIDFAPVATPALDSGKLFVGGDDGKFHCVDMATGDSVWNFDFKSIDFSAPVLYNDLVIFQTGSDRIVALGAKTGEWRWEYQHLRPADLAIHGLSRPTIDNGEVYLGLSSGYVICLDAATGRVIWKTRAFRGEQFTDVDGRIETDETNVYASSVGGEVAAISKKTGKVFWHYPVGGMGGIRLDGDLLIVASDEAEIVAIDKVSGTQVWSTKIDGGDKVNFGHLPTRPVIAGGFVMAVNRRGKVFVLDPATGEIVQTKSYFTDTRSPMIAMDDGSAVLFVDNRGVVRQWDVVASGVSEPVDTDVPASPDSDSSSDG